MQKRTFDDFDAFAPSYRDTHNVNIKISGADSAYFAEMKVKLLSKEEINTSLNFLDIGCGDGLTEVYIKKVFSQWAITGIDVSVLSIAEATNRNITDVNFATYNGHNIPLECDSVDVIFMAGVLHHVDEALHYDLLMEAKRVMKPGGRMYLFEHNPLNPLTRYLVNTCVFDKDAKLLWNNDALSLFAKVGLSVMSNQFIIFFPRHRFFKFLLRLEKHLKWLPLGGQYVIKAVK